MTSHLLARAAGLALGCAVDRAIADPSRLHPVAGFGALAARVESRLNREVAPDAARRALGVLYASAAVGGAALVGVLATRACAPGRSTAPAGPRAAAMGEMCVVAAATWVCVGGTSLLRIAAEIGAALSEERLEAARERLPWVCGRDPLQLDAQEMARAVVESLAENTSDAHVAPVFWAAVGGAPGVLAYRAANTLDAMVGHHNARFEDFGWASARLDDLLNWCPARVAGLLTVVLAPTVGGSSRSAWAAWREDASGHPSPNAGVVEATAAGALGVVLGGRTPYPYRMEWRAELHPGGAPARPEDIARAARLESRVQDASTVLAIASLLGGAGLVGAQSRLRRRRARRFSAATRVSP